MAYLSDTTRQSSKFLTGSQLVARGEATPLRGLQGVRNADDWPVGPQIGHNAVKQLDDGVA